jgi:transcription-repair coupling factor (superfamily II helicase)
LLSGDIKFRDLGLLVVDEEHRFGVVQKERIKKLKNLVDIVTLTATPIPRTLNFALNGIRDLSIINTPPVDRLAIKTHTCYFDDVSLREALLKEIQRGGQVYFVHNRVQSIEKIAAYLVKLMPEARVRVGHGQMNEDSLEKVMIAFMHHEFDIFVCTTIIESGLDIPNTNTIIINRADTFGLAQLYQLRGRVGRSHRQAYCYLIIPSEELLTEKARKRLAVIQRFTELGSGFKIATHDLEIRGAGNILGDEQSGHIAAVGYDMYIQFLQEAIAELKNTSLPEDFEPELSLSVPAKIPESFISDTQVRLILYKHMSSATHFEDIAATLEEWVDRFGKLPEEIHNLAALIKIKILCKTLLIAALKQSGTNIMMAFHPRHKLNPRVFMDAIQRNPKKFSLTRDGQFAITEKFPSAQALLTYLIELLLKLKESQEE